MNNSIHCGKVSDDNMKKLLKRFIDLVLATRQNSIH